MAFVPGVADPAEVVARLLDSAAAVNQLRPGAPLRLSIGAVAVAPKDERSLDVLIHDADQAMYANKPVTAR